MMSRLTTLLLPAAILLAIATCPHAAAASLIIVNSDAPGEGFNDPTPRPQAGGNTATTLGGQRLAVFERAAAIWNAALPSGPDIRVRASFDPLFCDSSSAVLGSASPIQVLRDFDDAPAPNTWYVSAQANTLAGRDLTPGDDEIITTFNSGVGASNCAFAWYYGLDGQTSGPTIDLLSVVVHELAHGLGFVSLMDINTGALLANRNDAYTSNLLDATDLRPLVLMSDLERLAAITKPEQLHWTGQEVTEEGVTLTDGVGPAGRVHMYSPPQLRRGSSVSHFSTSLFPNDLMEPSYTAPNTSIRLASALLSDLGWPGSNGTASCVASPETLCLQSNRFKIEAMWRGFDGNGGQAHVAPVGTGDSGLFYFYGPSNWEILTKIVDACGSNGNHHYWVFAAAATTLEFRISVTDTRTGQVRTYENRLGTQAEPITDTEAFATCDN